MKDLKKISHFGLFNSLNVSLLFHF